jgi:F-type H+-transporting ATPase subunit a
MADTLLGLIPGFNENLSKVAVALGVGHAEEPMLDNAHAMVPVVLLLLSTGAAVGLAAVAGGKLKDTEAAVIPDEKLSVRTFFELFLDMIMGMMIPIMGEKNSKRFLPLIGSVAVVIFFSNFLGLFPGMAPPTESMSVNFAMAIVIFVATHVAGVQTNGFGHFAHMANPVGAWWGWFLAPIMLPIELISHIVRPVSLSLRLMGNMIGDHKVLAIFLGLVPLVVPMPFLLLGSIVCTVQTVVFSLLSMVYIGLALEEQHHDEGEGHH